MHIDPIAVGNLHLNIIEISSANNARTKTPKRMNSSLFIGYPVLFVCSCVLCDVFVREVCELRNGLKHDDGIAFGAHRRDVGKHTNTPNVCRFVVLTIRSPCTLWRTCAQWKSAISVDESEIVRRSVANIF